MPDSAPSPSTASPGALPRPPRPIDAAPFIAAAGAAAVDAPGTAADTAAFAIDGVAPALAVRPPDVDTLAATLRTATEQRLAVVIQGGRTAVGIGNPPTRYDVALDTRSLDAVVAYEPDDFTVTVQAGMVFADLQRTLAERGQFLPLDPPHPAGATVGGVIALGRGGVRQGAFGTVRDWLIGCALVRADGVRLKGGGRVVKNVSGYDFPKLFAGSFGTLGCIVEATFKLRPQPPVDETLVLAAADWDTALAAARRLAHEVNGLQGAVALDAATARLVGLPGPSTIVRTAGMEPAVAATLDAVRGNTADNAAGDTADKAAGHVTVEATADAPALWQRIADLEGGPQADGGVLLRCGVPSRPLPEAAATIAAAAPGARLWSYADGALLFAELPPAAADAPRIVRLREQIEALGGALTVDVAAPALKASLDVWGAPGGVVIMRGLKERFDPEATLSPGRFVAEI